MNWTGVQAVTFDVGGTLIEAWPSVGDVYAQVAARHGLAVSPAALNERFAHAWRERCQFDHSRAAWKAIVDLSFAGLIPGSPGAELFDEIYRQFASIEAWRVFPDVRPMLDALRRGGFRLGVISNWDERLRGLLDQLELSPYFEAVAISSEVGFAKPAAAIFERAAAELQMAPRAILHVGDSVAEDLDGAQGAGLRTVLLDRKGRGGWQEAIRTLGELRAGAPH